MPLLVWSLEVFWEYLLVCFLVFVFWSADCWLVVIKYHDLYRRLLVVECLRNLWRAGLGWVGKAVAFRHQIIPTPDNLLSPLVLFVCSSKRVLLFIYVAFFFVIFHCFWGWDLEWGWHLVAYLVVELVK